MILHLALPDSKNCNKNTNEFNEYSKFKGFYDLATVNYDRYLTWQFNEHHWTTTYCWNTVIPFLFDKLQINFNSNDFIKITKMHNEFDISYHNPINTNLNMHYYDYSNNVDTACNFLYLRMFGENDPAKTNMCITDYHRLYRGWHKVSKIVNLNSILNKKLLLNCDSMFIPIIPILAYYYNEIFVLDNRYNTNIMNYLNIFKNDDYICAVTVSSINSKFYIRNFK